MSKVSVLISITADENWLQEALDELQYQLRNARPGVGNSLHCDSFKLDFEVTGDEHHITINEIEHALIAYQELKSGRTPIV